MQRYIVGPVSKKLEADGPSYFKALSQLRVLQVEENLENFRILRKPTEILTRFSHTLYRFVKLLSVSYILTRLQKKEMGRRRATINHTPSHSMSCDVNLQLTTRL
jgi:hypothetical protein